MTIEVRLNDIKNADTDRTIPEYRKWYYTTALTLVRKDPTLGMQLDIGPAPGDQGQLDAVINHIHTLFGVFISGLPDSASKAQRWRGLIGSLSRGVVSDLVPVFASIVTSDDRAQDQALLAQAYILEYTYLTDCGARGVIVKCLPESLHEDALGEAGFQQQARLSKVARGVRHSINDMLIYTRMEG